MKPCLDIEEAQSTLKLEEIFDKLPTVAQLEEFKALLEAVPLGDIKQLFIVFESKHLELSDTSVREKIEKEMQATALKRDQEIELFKTRSQKESVDTSIEWSPKQVSCLIKAVASIVGGNANRWEKIAEYVNHHAPEQGKCATADDCVKMSKKVQQEGLESVQIKQQQNIPKKSNGAVDEPTVRFEEVVDKNAWSAADQAKLEAALKKFPGTSFQKNPNERWNRIAAELPERTKEDIKKRVKDLQEMVKLKKKASKMNLN